jgi:hypothetical protein
MSLLLFFDISLQQKPHVATERPPLSARVLLSLEQQFPRHTDSLYFRRVHRVFNLTSQVFAQLAKSVKRIVAIISQVGIFPACRRMAT